MKILLGCVVLLAGCMNLGVSEMSPDQIKATNGMITCTQLATTYGRGVAVTINADDVRKGATNKSKITMTPDCAATVETDMGVVKP